MKFWWLRVVEWARWPVWYRRRRRELAGWTRHFGLQGVDGVAAACSIARRCAGAEAALKRLGDAAERELEAAGIPGLSSAEIERLAMLAEECGEVAQAVGKVLRHGWESQSPFGDKRTARTNRVALERELGDVRAVFELMLDARDLRLTDVRHWQRRKRDALRKWTHYQVCSTPREEKPS